MLTFSILIFKLKQLGVNFLLLATELSWTKGQCSDRNENQGFDYTYALHLN